MEFSKVGNKTGATREFVFINSVQENDKFLKIFQKLDVKIELLT